MRNKVMMLTNQLSGQSGAWDSSWKFVVVPEKKSDVQYGMISYLPYAGENMNKAWLKR
jgi:hypothetical protein